MSNVILVKSKDVEGLSGLTNDSIREVSPGSGTSEKEYGKSSHLGCIYRLELQLKSL